MAIAMCATQKLRDAGIDRIEVHCYSRGCALYDPDLPRQANQMFETPDEAANAALASERSTYTQQQQICLLLLRFQDLGAKLAQVDLDLSLDAALAQGREFDRELLEILGDLVKVRGGVNSLTAYLNRLHVTDHL